MTLIKKFLLCNSILIFLFSYSQLALGDASLADQIQQYMQRHSNNKSASKFSQADIKVMTEAANSLAKAMPHPGLKVGDKAPDFNLPNAFGKRVQLSRLLRKGPVIINFYRGAWCPYCNLELRALTKHVPEFKRYSATLVSITPQKPDISLKQVKKDKLPFDILSDLDSSVIKKYKLFFTIPGELVKVYKKLGLDIESFNGIGRNELPVPGTYVVDKKGIIRAAFADTDYKKRMEPSAIIETLKKL